MNAEETEICEFLKRFGEHFVPVNEISKRLGHRKCYDQDRSWPRPILRRMEMEGILEANPFGEYRIRNNQSDTNRFKAALNSPGASLGDTTIIFLDESKQA